MIRAGLGFIVLVASVAFISGHSRKVRSNNVQPEVDLRPAITNCSDLADQVLFLTFCSAHWSAFFFFEQKINFVEIRETAMTVHVSQFVISKTILA